jgi:hypothetical protein
MAFIPDCRRYFTSVPFFPQPRSRTGSIKSLFSIRADQAEIPGIFTADNLFQDDIFLNLQPVSRSKKGNIVAPVFKMFFDQIGKIFFEFSKCPAFL